MKGRVVLLDHVAGRAAAALMVDGRLEDLLIDAPDGAPPGIGAVAQAKAGRPMKGQGGLMLDLGDGHRGYLRRARDKKPGQVLLVQVSAIPEVGKAIPVTPDITLKSRYAIVTPFAPGLNISKQIRDADERDRLLEIAHDSAVAEAGFGLILRSAASGVASDAIAEDIAATCDAASAVMAARSGAPAWLRPADGAWDLAWRDWVDPDPDAVIDAPGCFDGHGVTEAVADVLGAQLRLGGGARAFVEPTRAMIAIDVNTGGDTSAAAGLKANLALAKELPRALRLKGLGGQITLDLAPMPKKERPAFEAALRRGFRQDGADIVLAGWTPLGNFELQKKRDRMPLSQIWPASD